MVLLVLFFAAWVTVHVALSYSVGKRGLSAMGWLALLVIPVAPWLGLRLGLRWQSITWLALLCLYGATWVGASY